MIYIYIDNTQRIVKAPLTLCVTLIFDFCWGYCCCCCCNYYCFVGVAAIVIVIVVVVVAVIVIVIVVVVVVAKTFFRFFPNDDFESI